MADRRKNPTIGFRLERDLATLLKAEAKTYGLSPGAYAKEATMERMMNAGQNQIFAEFEHLKSKIELMEDDAEIARKDYIMTVKLIASLIDQKRSVEDISMWVEDHFTPKLRKGK